MRNFIIVSMICWFLATAGYGQTNLVKFKAGPDFESPRTNELGFVGNNALGIINVTTRRGQLILTRFNPANLSESNQQEEELNKDRNFNSEYLANMNGKFYWLSSEWDKQNEKEKLYSTEIDPKNCKLKEQSLILEAPKMAADQLGGGVMLSASKSINKYQFNYSADRKRLLISYRLIPESRIDKNNIDNIGLQVFDENMKKLWGSEFTMPYSTARMENSEYRVDPSGNAYILSKIYNSDSRKEKVDDKPGFHYELLKFNEGSNAVKSFTISPENYFITSSSIVEGGKNELFVVSIFNKSTMDNKPDGIYIMKMDAGGNLVKFNNGFYELPQEELAKFESKKIKRKQDNRNKNENGLKIRSMYIQGDGSFFMSGEDYTRISTPTSSSYNCTWYYDNIIAIKFDSDGKAAWVRQIQKQQQNIGGAIYGENAGQLSYMPLADESGYYFLFNDNADNFNLKADEEPKLFRDGDPGNLVMLKLDQQGKVSKQLLYGKEEREKIYPTEFTKLTPLQLVGKCWKSSKEFAPMLIMIGN